MAILEIRSGIATKEFELQVDNEAGAEEYYLTVSAYGDFFEEIFNTINAVREYLFKEWNFTEAQFTELVSKAVKNGQETIPDLMIDVDEQMHEQQELDEAYAESYAEFAESLIWD